MNDLSTWTIHRFERPVGLIWSRERWMKPGCVGLFLAFNAIENGKEVYHCHLLAQFDLSKRVFPCDPKEIIAARFWNEALNFVANCNIAGPVYMDEELWEDLLNNY